MERELIETGELTTWMQHQFSGTAMIMVPDRANVTAGQPPPLNALQDGRTKLWYQCPDIGFEAKACATCTGPRVRCYSYYGLPFR